MDLQIAITGRGGQGVLFLTRILSECALAKGLEVIASETHGMAMRGGSVISTLKVGAFRGPLIGSGHAGLMLVLDAGSKETFDHLLAPGGIAFLNGAKGDPHFTIDAARIASEMKAPLTVNLVLLGFALRSGKLFCSFAEVERVVEEISPPRFRDSNLKALRAGRDFSSGGRV